MSHPGGALRRNLPQVRGRLEKLVAGDRSRRGQSGGQTLARLEGPVEPAFAGDDDPFGHVPEHGITRSLECPPGAGTAGGPALPPDDFAPQEEAEVLKDLGHVAGQRTVRPPTQIGHVDRDAAPRFEHPLAFLEDALQEIEVFEIACPGRRFDRVSARTPCRRSRAGR